jgi:crotonobetainyl-CoA:carnitine CoA-transferase CaiB-like acyl-CoA transferase
MTLADLRKELKDLRKKAMPVPVSRMKKSDCVAELERLKGLRAGEEKAVEKVMKEEKVPKSAMKKVEKVHKEEHTKQDDAVKKTVGVKRKASPPPAKKAKTEDKPKDDKPAKGSEEMKARMAKLREMRKAKKDAKD